MTSATAVVRGRSAAERQMFDTFTAYAPTGSTQDADGMEVAAYEVVGTTSGKLQGSGKDTTTQTVNVGGVDRPVVIAGLHIPVGSPTPILGGKGVGWEYVLTTPGPATPPELVGSRWLVVDSPAKSAMTARRLDVVRLP